MFCSCRYEIGVALGFASPRIPGEENATKSNLFSSSSDHSSSSSSQSASSITRTTSLWSKHKPHSSTAEGLAQALRPHVGQVNLIRPGLEVSTGLPAFTPLETFFSSVSSQYKRNPDPNNCRHAFSNLPPSLM